MTKETKDESIEAKIDAKATAGFPKASGAQVYDPTRNPTVTDEALAAAYVEGDATHDADGKPIDPTEPKGVHFTRQGNAEVEGAKQTNSERVRLTVQAAQEAKEKQLAAGDEAARLTGVAQQLAEQANIDGNGLAGMGLPGDKKVIDKNIGAKRAKSQAGYEADEFAGLSDATRAEMEAGRAAIARHQPRKVD